MTFSAQFAIDSCAKQLAFGLLCATIMLCPASAVCQDETEKQPSDFSRLEKEQFLLHARILAIETLPIGVTKSQQSTLSDGVFTHEAHIQTVEESEKIPYGVGQKTITVRDYWGFNVAAYHVDKMLDLNMVPVSVERVVDKRQAAVTWWVDDVLMSLTEFRNSGRNAPDMGWINDQRSQGWAFQQLVNNDDPNLGNFVIDEDWKVWMLDFSRAFRKDKKLTGNPARLAKIGRGFLERLRSLDPDEVERALGEYLTRSELKGFLVRRDKMVQHFDDLIAERGEAVVLIDRSGF